MLSIKLVQFEHLLKIRVYVKKSFFTQPILNEHLK